MPKHTIGPLATLAPINLFKEKPNLFGNCTLKKKNLLQKYGIIESKYKIPKNKITINILIGKGATVLIPTRIQNAPLSRE